MAGQAASQAQGEALDAALRQSEAILLAVLNATQESLWLFAPNGRVVWGNATALQRFGLTAEQVVGRPFQAFMDPGLAQRRLAWLQEAVASGKPVVACDERAGIRFRHVFTPVLGAQGEVTQVVVYSQDITRSQQTETALQEAYAQAEEGRRLLQALMEQVPEGITLADAPHGEIRMVSRYGQELLGRAHTHLTIGEVTQRWQVFHPDGRTPMADAELPLVRALQQGEVVTDLELVQVNEQGVPLQLLCNAGPIRDAQGGIVGGIVVWRDIRARRAAEDALKRTVADLERSNRELEQYAYVASHDLQEPLRQVLVFVDLLRGVLGGRLDGKAAQYFAQVQEGASRMATLVRGLLDYSRVGAAPAADPPVASQECLNAALDTLQSRITELGAQITCDPLPTLRADPLQVTQLFQNLLSNALKFHREGVPPRIHVGCRRDGERQLFWVEDNGIGLDPQYQDRAFQLFQRLHDRETYAGTGIGLAICKKIIDRHGGRLWVESVPGAGATFFFTL